jgi:pyruvate carboxylase
MKRWSKFVLIKTKKIFSYFLSFFSIEIEHGKVLHIVVLAISELMIETGEREVFFQVNGQLRSMKVRDKTAIKDHKFHPKADKNKKTQIGTLNHRSSIICV